jgi:general secretion pathway protein I
MRRGDSGFTLLEVMVALAIVAIGLIAAFNGIIQMAHSTSVLRERALADWIAMNQITEIRISGSFPDVGRFDGDVEFAGREWRWEAQISETGVEGLRRIDMSVAYEETPRDAVTIVTGFVSQRAAGIVTQIDWWGAGAPDGEGGPGGDGGELAEEDRSPRQPRRDRSQPPPQQPEEQEE